LLHNNLNQELIQIKRADQERAKQLHKHILMCRGNITSKCLDF